MVKVDENKNIYISQGDTGVVEFKVTSGSFAEGDKVIFAVKPTPNSTEELLRKEVTVSPVVQTFQFAFASTDLQALATTIYKYDIRIISTNGAVYTPYAPRNFTILEVVAEIE